jgi:hypothetical protein
MQPYAAAAIASRASGGCYLDALKNGDRNDDGLIELSGACRPRSGSVDRR